MGSFLFAGYFAINDGSRVLVVATYLSICLTPKTLNLAVSHQNILANNSVYKLSEIENAVPIKYRNKLFSKFQIHPFGGDTPFYLISGRNQRFLFDG